ncbi:MAG TPA: ATP-binding protein [Nocardioides sp.]|uniref:PAS domain-containing hybrid sensor histidine kinase/response regulator n=1 Tax=Nocardioides sp. TaxID=35761 RepID=UPI002BBF11A0|nr:ATP-binding protein [Nocardioides sp.]HTW15259.1 ATP-binding protein [Nocardioides sp.]
MRSAGAVGSGGVVVLSGAPRRWRWLAVGLAVLGIVLIAVSVKLGYDLLTHAQEHERQFGDDAATIDGELVEDLRRLLVLLTAILLAGIALGVAGAWVLVRIDRHREQALAELREVNDDLSFYSRVLRATDSALAATDERGKILWVNEAFERATGWTLDVMRGQHAMDVLRGPGTDPEALQLLDEAMDRGERRQVELVLHGADGREAWLSLDASPLLDPEGVIEGYFAVMTDITERHELEQLHATARRAAELAAQEKATFLATMSHEIRTPLNAVLGLTDLLLMTELDEEQRDFVQTAQRSGSHLLALINDVLDYSSLESGRMAYADEPFSMRELLDETVGMFAASADQQNIALSLRCAPDLPPTLRGDTTRLRQVLVNVIGNAVKFTPEGAVVVRCEARDLPDGRVEVVTSVQDTGIGIPPERVPELFRSFVRVDASSTREHGGTGLGLAISRGLVEAMGGEIELSSAVGSGTRVDIRMTHDICPVSPEPVADQRPEPAAGLAVLVVEDDPVNRKVVTRMLDRLGIAAPTVVVNGQQAVDAVRRGFFDVVLMDVQMPVMDGLRAASLIREQAGEDRPWLVALTANALGGDRERFLAAGMDDYLSKPVVLDALAAALARVPQRERRS